MTSRFHPGLATLLLAALAAAAPVRIDIDCSKPDTPLSPHLYGLFFEDINFAADGGLYAELVQNRSFEYFPVRGNDPIGRQYHPLHAWTKVEEGRARVEMKVAGQSPLNPSNPHYLRLQFFQTGEEAGGAAGVANGGYDGIRLDEGAGYRVSLHARFSEWTGERELRVALELEDGRVCGETTLGPAAEGWTRLEGRLESSATTGGGEQARLVVTTTGTGRLDLDVVSLFPEDTHGGRPNGLRPDLVAALAELNPKFLRFPGGCIVHGSGLDNAYRWKDSVGEVAARKPNWNRWGYHQTYGLGYYEYFLLCEDLGATPLPVVPVGVSCGFNEPYQVVPMDELGEWIDDALDLIEFANGPADSEWGGLRASMGHPEPFGLEYLCLGNEEHDRAEMRERFPHFVRAIREAHPEIRLIGTSGLGPGTPLYDLMAELDVHSTDEHYYEDPEWFIANQNRFDDFDRDGPKIFVGEYASRGNTLFNAVAEAAFLTGVERNGDLVDMTCYAPLLANVRHAQWNPDLIYFDKRRVVRTPNYHVQKLFATHKGDAYLANRVTRPASDRLETISGRVGIGSWRTAIEVEDLKVNGQELDPAGWEVIAGDFAVEDGRYVQRDPSETPAESLGRAKHAGEEVTYTLRARKTTGEEGFLVIFGGGDGRRYWWNVGGWGNSRHALQVTEGNQRKVLTEKRGRVRRDRWHELRVELGPGRIRCLLNGELVHDHHIPHPGLSVSPTLDRATGDILVKLVNPTDQRIDTRIRLDHAGKLKPEAELVELSGERDALNTLEAPDRVRPETRTIRVAGEFDHLVPPMAVQVLRIRRE